MAHFVTSRSIAIANAGFENPSINVADVSQRASPIPDWTLYNANEDRAGVILYDLNTNPYTTLNDPIFGNQSPQGNQTGWLSQWDHDNSEFYVHQYVSESVTPNTLYSLKVWIGNPEGTILDREWVNNDGFGGYRVQLIADDVVLTEDDNTVTIPAYEWREITVNVYINDSNVHSGKQIGVRIVHKALGTSPLFSAYAVIFDDVRLNATQIAIPSTTNAISSIAATYSDSTYTTTNDMNAATYSESKYTTTIGMSAATYSDSNYNTDAEITSSFEGFVSTMIAGNDGIYRKTDLIILFIVSFLGMILILVVTSTICVVINKYRTSKVDVIHTEQNSDTKVQDESDDSNIVLDFPITKGVIVQLPKVNHTKGIDDDDEGYSHEMKRRGTNEDNEGYSHETFNTNKD